MWASDGDMAFLPFPRQPPVRTQLPTPMCKVYPFLNSFRDVKEYESHNLRYEDHSVSIIYTRVTKLLVGGVGKQDPCVRSPVLTNKV